MMKLLMTNDAQEEFSEDKRSPYLLIAVKEDGSGVVLESHSAGIEWLRDGIDHEEFLESYLSNAPTEIGLYEWRGKIGSTRSFEGEIDYHLNSEWTTVWKW